MNPAQTASRAIALGLALLASSCSLFETSAGTGAPAWAEGIVKRVEDLAADGQFREANVLVTRGIADSEEGTPADGLLRYTDAWLQFQESRTLTDEPRTQKRSDAATSFRRLLASHPNYEAGIRGLTSVSILLGDHANGIEALARVLETSNLQPAAATSAWIGIGDLQLASFRRSEEQAGAPEEALTAYERAYQIGHDQQKAAARIVTVTDDPAALMTLAEQFAKDKLVPSAESALLKVLELPTEGMTDDERHDIGNRATERWLHIAGMQQEFDKNRFDQVHDKLENRPELLELLAVWMQFVEVGGVDELPSMLNGRADSQALAAAQAAAAWQSDAERREMLDGFLAGWQATPAREQALALAMRSWAESIVRNARTLSATVDHLRAAALYEVAMDLVAGPEHGAMPPAVAGDATPRKWDIQLSIAVDQAAFLSNQRSVPNAIQRFRRLVRSPHGPLSAEVWDVKQDRIPSSQRIEYFGLLGLIFENDEWLDLPEDHHRAIKFLGLAIDEGAAAGQKLPHLEQKLGDALAKTDRNVLGVAAYHESARNYQSLDQDNATLGASLAGLELGIQKRDELNAHIRALELILYPRDGFYVGGSFGWTDGNESAGDLERELNRRTPTGRDVDVTLDDTDNGYKAFAGYRFDGPFALEFGWTGLEGPDSRIDANVIDANLPADVTELHPLTGRGPSLSLLGYPYECGRLSTFARLGVWYWQSDVDVALGNSSVQWNGDGIDAVVGLGLQYRVLDRISVRVEAERYFLDDNGVDMVSVGLAVKL